MIRDLVIVLSSLALAANCLAQQTIVFPAVVDEVPGHHGSLWVSIARIIKTNPGETVTVRRKWVCLPNGGFVDDPANAPSWTLNGSEHYAEDQRILFKWGDALLAGSNATAGAIALEIEGGQVIAHTIAHDVSRGYDAPQSYTFGQGQFIRGIDTPLVGPSHIPYLGACLNSPCSNSQPNWLYLRNNIGLVNPNPEWLTIKGIVIPFDGHGPFPNEIKDPEPETFRKVVPPYGWLQFRWSATQRYGPGPSGLPILPTAGFVIGLTPERDDVPYYAYASVVFTPDPESGNQMFNDPMFVPAEPGYVAPFVEVFPPKARPHAQEPSPAADSHHSTHAHAR